MKPWAKEILQELAKNGDGYGLSLEERLDRSRWAPPSIYPLLRKLEREGFLRSYESEPLPERGNRPRIYYSITELGRRALEAN